MSGRESIHNGVLQTPNIFDKVVFRYNGANALLLKPETSDILALRNFADTGYKSLKVLGLIVSAGGTLNLLDGRFMVPNSGIDIDNCMYFDPVTRKLWIFNGDDLDWNFVTLGL